MLIQFRIHVQIPNAPSQVDERARSSNDVGIAAEIRPQQCLRGYLEVYLRIQLTYDIDTKKMKKALYRFLVNPRMIS